MHFWLSIDNIFIVKLGLIYIYHDNQVICIHTLNIKGQMLERCGISFGVFVGRGEYQMDR